MTCKLIICAMNVHQGGGGALLSALLDACPNNRKVVALLDSRMTLPANLPENLTTKFLEPSLFQRLRIEWWLTQNVQPQDIILCFGNLPPLFKLCGHVVVFIQNRYLVHDVKLDGFALKTRLRLGAERIWLSRRMANADEFVVQTPSMKYLLEARIRGRALVRVLPFMASHDGYERKVRQQEMQQGKNFDFLYVASGEPHKNHLRLIEAWCLLADEGLFPSLCLTLGETRFAGLCREIDVMRQRYGLKLKNAGELSHQDVLALYKKAGASIYPSTFESFGLPLIEARQAGLPVLASELDYVRDVLDPEQTFDPDSPTSIARSVKRFMGMDEQPLPLLDAAQFLASILKRVAQ